MSSPSVTAPVDALPSYTSRLLAFQACNALSFTLGMGTPLILVASYIGADKGQVGLMISFTSLLAILQLLAVRRCERIGYKKVLLAGWSMRAFFLLAVVPLPLLVGHVPSAWLVWALMAAIVGFNAVRGYAAGSWFPWLTSLIPSHQRGRFFGVDQLVFNSASLVALVASGLFLGEAPEAWRYSLIYLLSFVIGIGSVQFMRPVPCATDLKLTMPLPVQDGPTGFWRDVRHVWAHPPFRYTTIYIALHGLALSAPPGFLAVFLHEEWGWNDRTVLLLSAAQTCGVLATSVMWGRLSDRAGSRPLMRMADIGVIACFALWGACAAGWIKLTPWTAAPPFLALGVLLAAHATSSTRLMLAVCPPREVTVGIAFFQVWSALTRGLAPIVWGQVLLRLKAEGGATFGLPAYALLFWSSVAILLAAQVLQSLIVEPAAMRTPRLLVQMFWEFGGRVSSAFVSSTRRQ